MKFRNISGNLTKTRLKVSSEKMHFRLAEIFSVFRDDPEFGPNFFRAATDIDKDLASLSKA